MRLLLFVGLLCATAPRAAGPAPGSEEAIAKDNNLQEATRRAVELKETAIRQGMELKVLRTAYESDPDPARFAAQRDRARFELKMTLDSLEIMRKKYLVLGSAIVYTRALDTVAKKRDGPRPLEGDILDITSVNRFDKQLQRTHRRLEGEMKEEAPAFAAARRRARGDRAWRASFWMVCACGLGALLAAVAYGLRLVRQSAPPPALEAPAALETPRAVVRAEDWAFGTQWATERDGRPAVIRLLAAEFSNIGREAERMADLVRAATSFRHPSIEEVREVGVSPDGVFMVLGPSAGRPLADVLGAGTPLARKGALDVMGPVARALDAAHKAGFAHGSLTPERILILPDGSGRLTDFGLARALATRKDARAGVFSPAYSAPEVSEGTILLASDLFSFGVVLYEALFVRLPFDGPNLAALKLERRFSLPSALLGRPAPRVDGFFAGVLEPEGRLRRPSAGGLAAALDAFSELAG